MPLTSFKLFALVATEITHLLSITPPIPPPGPDDEVYTGQAFERGKILPILRHMSGAMLTTSLACEFVLIVAAAYPATFPLPPALTDAICPRSPNPAALQSTPFAFLFGFFLIMAGCSLRVWCYRVLGRLFTYEVTFRPAHTLVTRAPYNLVRHPSYTGLYLHFIGVAVLHFAPGSWNRECGIMNTRGGIWVWVWLVLSTFTFVSVAKRATVEDRMMKEKFGDAWEKYRRDVPCMFFPGII